MPILSEWFLEQRLTMPRSALSLPLRLQARALLSRSPFLLLTKLGFNAFVSVGCSSRAHHYAVATSLQSSTGWWGASARLLRYFVVFLVVDSAHFCRFKCKVPQQLVTSFGNNLFTHHIQGISFNCNCNAMIWQSCLVIFSI